MKYGERYRKLRVKQGYSLMQASSGIISEPTLSRWETGKGPMDINMILPLLKRINCTIEDLFWFKDSKIEKKIVQLFENDNEREMYELICNLLKTFNQRLNDYDCLFYIIMACNYYQKMTTKNLLTDLIIRRLTAKFSNISIWTENNISLINMSLPLINSDLIFNIAQNIRKGFSDIVKENKQDIIYKVLEIYVKSLYILIKKGYCDKAYFLSQHSKSIIWPEYCCNLKIKFIFYKYLLISKITGDSEDMNNFISELSRYDLKNILFS